MTSSYILIGVILRPFGIAGGLCVKSFAESALSFKSYNIFYSQDGLQTFKVRNMRADKKDVFVIYFDSIKSRTEAEKFKHQELYIESSQLKLLKTDEYYHHHLINLNVFDDCDQKIGVVQKVMNYGSGDLLEILSVEKNQIALIPFNARFVKQVHLTENRIIVDRDDVDMLLSLNSASS